ncbi:uncharacterized protein LOC126298091 [Schistocerca gregaria]|uniref:uncharacterized protein LOC126298091 n=1 Tax=Schistocerca gregaria TaxID=7010 RepID=UPI00211F12B6|nr:uncharacterized protein LOC126298091 [Schistocerca gregaria]
MPQPTTPPTAPPPLGTPPQAPRLPSSKSPLPAWFPSWDRHLSPPLRPHPTPLPPPPQSPCSSVFPVPIDAEAAVTPPPPSPTEVVAPLAHPSIPNSGARPGQVFDEQIGVASGQHAPAVPLFAPSAAPPWAPPPVVGRPTQWRCITSGGGMWYR